MGLRLVRVDAIVGAPPLPAGMPSREDDAERIDPWAAVLAPRSRTAYLTAPDR